MACPVCKEPVKLGQGWTWLPDETKPAPAYLPKEAAGVSIGHYECRKGRK